jgi:hypothetical protein
MLRRSRLALVAITVVLALVACTPSGSSLYNAAAAAHLLSSIGSGKVTTGTGKDTQGWDTSGFSTKPKSCNDLYLAGQGTPLAQGEVGNSGDVLKSGLVDGMTTTARIFADSTTAHEYYLKLSTGLKTCRTATSYTSAGKKIGNESWEPLAVKSPGWNALAFRWTEDTKPFVILFLQRSNLGVMAVTSDDASTESAASAIAAAVAASSDSLKPTATPSPTDQTGSYVNTDWTFSNASGYHFTVTGFVYQIRPKGDVRHPAASGVPNPTTCGYDRTTDALVPIDIYDPS